MSCPALIMSIVTEPPAWDADLQRLLNAHPVPARRTQHWTLWPRPVTVRCQWELDGEERQAGSAVAWTSTLVLVHFPRELRLQVHGAWFAVVDVESTASAARDALLAGVPPLVLGDGEVLDVLG